MNSFPCKRKKLQPPLLPRFFTLPRPQGLGGLRVPEDGWLLFLVSSHWSEGPGTPTKIRVQQSSMEHFKICNLSSHIEVLRPYIYALRLHAYFEVPVVTNILIY